MGFLFGSDHCHLVKGHHDTLGDFEIHALFSGTAHDAVYATGSDDGITRLQGVLQGLHLILALALLPHGHKGWNNEQDANDDENDDFHSFLVCQTLLAIETPGCVAKHPAT